MNGPKKAKAPIAQGRKFTMWFSTDGDGKADAHMKELRQQVEKMVTQSNGRMKAVFNKQASLTMSI